VRIDQVETSLAVTGMQVDPDFATLGGFLLHQLGHLPAPGEGYEWNGWRFEVIDLDGQRIGNVRAVRV
jgi:putative hemolysin